jgi:hypothetical protein
MILYRRLILNIPLVTAVFLASAISQTKSPVKPSSPSSGIKIERRTPDEGMIITRYQDLRSGRMLLVTGDTQPDTARGWLASLVEMKAENEATYTSQMTKMVSTYKPSGMLGLALPEQAVLISVYSNALPVENEIITINALDIRSGASVNMNGNASEEDGLAWLKVAREADSEAGFLALVKANHTKGLISITSVWNGILVKTVWQRK